MRVAKDNFEGLRSAAARVEAREPRGDGRERRGPKVTLVTRLCCYVSYIGFQLQLKDPSWWSGRLT